MNLPQAIVTLIAATDEPIVPDGEEQGGGENCANTSNSVGRRGIERVRLTASRWLVRVVPIPARKHLLLQEFV